MKNTIKRKTNTIKVKTLIDFAGGVIPQNTILIINKEQNVGWFGGGYQWSLNILRDATLIELIDQV